MTRYRVQGLPNQTIANAFLGLCGHDETASDSFSSLATRWMASGPNAFPASNAVYVPAAIGGQYGHIMKLLLRRSKDRVKAVIIAFFGIRKPITCQQCVTRTLGK